MLFVCMHGTTRDGEPIKPLFLELPGEPLVKWTMWLAIVRDYLLAYDLDHDP